MLSHCCCSSIASAVTHQLSAELSALEQAATMLNDSNAVSCTVPIFAGNEAVPFPGIRERKMTGIPGRPGNGSPGMKTVLSTSCRHTAVSTNYPSWWYTFSCFDAYTRSESINVQALKVLTKSYHLPCIKVSAVKLLLVRLGKVNIE